MPGTTDTHANYIDYYTPPKTFVKSAIRVMNVLEFFYRSRQPARAADISRALELPVSSTKYLLTSLVDSGYLTFDKESKEYFPSILFAGMASWLAAIYPSGETLRALSRDLQATLGHTVSVVVQHDQFMRALIIETASPETPPAYDFRARIPLASSASGLVALSTKSDREVMDYLDQEARKLPPELRDNTRDPVLEQIRLIRQRGYGIREHRVDDHGTGTAFMAIAIPLPVDARLPPMVLGIAGPSAALKGREQVFASALASGVDKYREALRSEG